jgi:hypothetical protein
MNPDKTKELHSERPELEAVFLYAGILDAYEEVGIELIGPKVLEEHVLPRMVYYVREFLPEVFLPMSGSDKLTADLGAFLKDFREKVEKARQSGSTKGLSMEEIWKLRAAIFGFESVFINILGETAIKEYLFARIADILSAYLPERLLDTRVSLRDKLEAYAEYLRSHGFVGYARVSFEKSGTTVAVNKCAFARIHDSDAYKNLNVRFCPWGMIASAIVAGHEGKETVLKSSTFTTRGSVSEVSQVRGRR